MKVHGYQTDEKEEEETFRVYSIEFCIVCFVSEVHSSREIRERRLHSFFAYAYAGSLSVKKK